MVLEHNCIVCVRALLDASALFSLSFLNWYTQCLCVVQVEKGSCMRACLV